MSRKIQVVVPMIVLLVFISRCAPGLALQYDNERKIFINEVCSLNACIEETDKHFNDYIELYNASDQEVSLDGWFLSDDEQNLKKCELSGVSILPKSYLLIIADGEGEDAGEVAFKIDSDGESLFLTDSYGNLIDNVRVPALEANTVWARTKDGSSEWKRMTPTPRKNNDEGLSVRNEILDEPVFSKQSGFYEEPFCLELSVKKDEIIYYTLDGSIPTEHSFLYEGGIMITDPSSNENVYNSIQNVVENWKEYTPSQELVDKAVVVRAVAVDAAGNTSDIATAAYFIGLDQYKNADVLMLTADPDELFGEDGIYVTGKSYDDWYLSGSSEEMPEPLYMKEGRNHEIEANIQLFEQGVNVMNQEAGIRIQGSSTRHYPKKRFSIYARKEYDGSSYFNYEMFENRKTHSFMLQNQFANALFTELVSNSETATISSRPVIVFLNGEYWYTAYMQEKYNKHYLKERYGVNPDNVIIIKEGILEEGDRKGLHFYEMLYEFLANSDFTTDQSYEELNQIMDIQSFIEWVSANVYLCNMDVSEEHNYMLWRTFAPEESPYGDERWRWMIYDIGYVEEAWLGFYQVENAAEINSFAWKMQTTDQAMDENTVFQALKVNDTFRRQFVLSFLDMANIDFAPSTVSGYLEAWGEDLSWKDGFFEKRFDYIVPYLAEEFGLQGTLERLTLNIEDPESGTIQINSRMPDLSDGVWTGQYYTDYPVTLTATANEGYRFVGWQGGNTSEEETITVQLQNGGTDIEAIFEKIEE